MSKIIVDTIESTGTTVTVNDALSATSVTGLSASSLTTGTLPNAQLADGHILQVVQTTFTGMFESTSTSYTAVTGMSASITPSSTSSKILIIVQSSGANTTSTANSSFTIYFYVVQYHDLRYSPHGAIFRLIYIVLVVVCESNAPVHHDYFVYSYLIIRGNSELTRLCVTTRRFL